MARRYRVVGSNAFEREVRRLRTRLPHVYKALLGAVELLETDPFNLEGRGNIRKLVDVPAGEGQFRLRIGDYRLRCNVIHHTALLAWFQARRAKADGGEGLAEKRQGRSLVAARGPMTTCRLTAL